MSFFSSIELIWISGQPANKMQNSLQIKLIFLSLLLIALLAVSDGQFFTKTGSKSIPRMGRRADNSLWSLIPQNPSLKRKIVETILNKYNDKSQLKSVKSETHLPKVIDQMEPTEDKLEIKSEKPRTLSLQSDEDIGDRFDTNSEVRKLQKIFHHFIDKTQNGL